MTREKRLKHIAEGKIVLKARRNPKLNIWEIVYYNGASYNNYNWDRYETRERCEAGIMTMTHNFPGLYVAETESDNNAESESCAACQECKDKDDLIKQLYRCIEEQKASIEMLHTELAKKPEA